MALSYKAKRRWSLVVLLIGLPLYVVVSVSIVGLFDRPGVLLEMLIYVVLGVLWALPFRALFRGIGKPEPEPEPEPEAAKEKAE